MCCDKERCSGCGACVESCKVNALTMTLDKMNGFFYPTLDKSKCIKCGNCKKVCPVLVLPHLERVVPSRAYACQSRCIITQKASSSGGIFPALAKYVLSKKGVVFGVVYADSKTVVTCAAETSEDILPMSGSKYVQSQTQKTYSETKRFLRTGRQVLYSGTPCQIAGLYAFLGQDDSNLVTVAIVCHGVTSPVLYAEYVRFLEEKHHTKIDRINFRDKEYGWNCGSTASFIDTSGKKYRLEGNDNCYLRGFVRNPNIFKRECCYSCPHKSFPTLADLTIGDYWDLPKQNEYPFDIELGVSLVLINSAKGNLTFNAIADSIVSVERPFEEVNRGTLVHSVSKDTRRDQFLDDSTRLSFVQLAKKYFFHHWTLRRLLSKLYRFFVGYPE